MSIFTTSEVIPTDPHAATPAALAALAECLKANGAWGVSYNDSHLKFGEVQTPRQAMYIGSGVVDILSPNQIRIVVTTSWLNLALPYFVSALAITPALRAVYASVKIPDDGP